jgi:antibiotic biosynthesis monooxygenase (ABM) superfamily enzyme
VRKDCALLHDRTVLSTEKTPHDKRRSIWLDQKQNLIMSPGGAQSQEGLTGWLTGHQLQRNFDSDSIVLCEAKISKMTLRKCVTFYDSLRYNYFGHYPFSEVCLIHSNLGVGSAPVLKWFFVLILTLSLNVKYKISLIRTTILTSVFDLKNGL